jgi:hypothetical protein
MFLLFWEKGSLLLGYIPETLGLLLFGVALIMITVILRWVLNKTDDQAMDEENFEKLAEKLNR